MNILIARKRTLAVVCLIALSVHSAFATEIQSDCVRQYQNLKMEKAGVTSRGVGGAAVGGSAVGGLVAMAIVGSTGIGTVVLLVVTAGGGLYLAYISKTAEIEIKEKLNVLKLYEQSREFLNPSSSNSQTNMPVELLAFTSGIDGSVRASVPSMIVKMMETGILCESGKPLNGLQMLEALQSLLTSDPMRRPSEHS
jgi:hypothetical protein